MNGSDLMAAADMAPIVGAVAVTGDTEDVCRDGGAVTVGADSMTPCPAEGAGAPGRRGGE